MELAPRGASRPAACSRELIYTPCPMGPLSVRGSQGHGTWQWGGEEEGRERGWHRGPLLSPSRGHHNSSTVASWAGSAMGFRRAVNHLSGGRAFPPVLKRLRFPSRRSDGKLGEGGGGQVLEIFSGGIPNRIPLKSDPGREVDAVQLTSGPRCAGARTNSCIEDSWAISSGHPHWECFLLPCGEGGRRGGTVCSLCSSQMLAGGCVHARNSFWAQGGCKHPEWCRDVGRVTRVQTKNRTLKPFWMSTCTQWCG